MINSPGHVSTGWNNYSCGQFYPLCHEQKMEGLQKETALYPKSPYLIVKQNVLLCLCSLLQQAEAFFLLPQGAFICSARPFPVSQGIYIINVWTKCGSHSSLCSQKHSLHEEDKEDLSQRF